VNKTSFLVPLLGPHLSQSPRKAFNASTTSHPIRGRSHHFKKESYMDLRRDWNLPFYTRSNVCAISSASFKATRPFCFTLVTALRASTLALMYVTSNYYITYASSHLTLLLLPFGLFFLGEHLLENRTHTLLFFDSRMGRPFACSSWILPFLSLVKKSTHQI
jgi:hypothetical protein